MSMTASEIAAELGLRRAGSHGWSGDCPACGYRNGLRLNEKEGRALWWCASCQDKDALTEAVTGRAPRVQLDSSAAPAGADNAARTAKAMLLWEDRYPLIGSPAEHYLGRRGLSAPDGAALGYLRDAWHPSKQRCGCMIALATNATGEGQAVHRTYLAPGGTGKAALDPPRATLGPVGGAVVRLCNWVQGQPLVIGEGIETSLSAGILIGAPAWAALSAGNMARVPLPDGLQDLVIAADPDEPGQRAAWAAADGFIAAGLRVRVVTPDTDGEDFNDLLQRQMAQAVPNG
jgi:phage/plasmid primase-like uncharacterized protein